MRNYPLNYFNLSSGERLAYRQAGDGGPLVLLLHGNQSSSVFLQPLMAELEGECRVFALDMLGFGASDYSRQFDTLAEFAQPVAEFMRAFFQEAAAVLGWSTGGGVALELALQVPNLVQRLILLDSVGVQGYPMYAANDRGGFDLERRVHLRSELADHPLICKPVREAQAQGNTAFMRLLWNQLIYNLKQPEETDYQIYLAEMVKQRNLIDVLVALANFNLSSHYNGVVQGDGRLKQITCPVHWIHGRFDLVVPLSFAEASVQEFEPPARLTVLEKTGHSAITDDLPALLHLLRADILG